LKQDWPGWWAVPEVFRQMGPTVVMGLDTVLNGNIDDLFRIAQKSDPSEFWMIRAFHPRNDYASGIMVYNGDFRFIYEGFNLERAMADHGRSGEQEHTKVQLRARGIRIRALQEIFPGIYSYKRHCRHRVPKDCRVVLFHGKPRPWEIKGLWQDLPDKSKYSRIPCVWPDSTVYILGGGPSLVRANLTALRGEKLLGVNQAFELPDLPVEYCYSGDRRWYGWNWKRLRDSHYRGIMITSYTHFTPMPEAPVLNVRRVAQHGISSAHPGLVAWNGHSGATAVNVAYWLGARRIVLLGFDQTHDRGVFNWHDRYPRQKRNPNGFFPNPYRRFLSCWQAIAADAKKLGVEILNATDGGQLHCFPRVRLEETL
jgi:hypothetical protein